MEKRQFCRKGIHTCIPSVTLTFRSGAGRLHWCAEHAADAEQYRPHADESEAASSDNIVYADESEYAYDHAEG